MSNKLYIGNLPYRITEAELQQAFAAYGDASEVKIVMDRATGRSRGFGFVTFPNAEEAKSALAGMDGKEVQGRPLRVKIAEERDRNSGGGHGGRKNSHRGGHHGGHGDSDG